MSSMAQPALPCALQYKTRRLWLALLCFPRPPRSCALPVLILSNTQTYVEACSSRCQLMAPSATPCF